MKKLLVIAGALALVLAMVGCAQPAQSSSSAASASTASSASASQSASASATSAPVNATSTTDDADDDDADDSDEATNGSKYISEDEAEDIAVSVADMGLPKEVDADLEEGGDAPHYVVTLKSDDMVRVIEIDAATGEVWSNQVATPPPSNSNEDDDDVDDDVDDDDGDVD